MRLPSKSLTKIIDIKEVFGCFSPSLGFVSVSEQDKSGISLCSKCYYSQESDPVFETTQVSSEPGWPSPITSGLTSNRIVREKCKIHTEHKGPGQYYPNIPSTIRLLPQALLRSGPSASLYTHLLTPLDTGPTHSSSLSRPVL